MITIEIYFATQILVERFKSSAFMSKKFKAALLPNQFGAASPLSITAY
jgi:hypothetical protein